MCVRATVQLQYILVIVKCESKKFLLFEVEVGGNQVEEFVRQELRLETEITNQLASGRKSKHNVNAHSATIPPRYTD